MNPVSQFYPRFKSLQVLESRVSHMGTARPGCQFGFHFPLLVMGVLGGWVGYVRIMASLVMFYDKVRLPVKAHCIIQKRLAKVR
jgi:hypothetical protein